MSHISKELETEIAKKFFRLYEESVEKVGRENWSVVATTMVSILGGILATQSLKKSTDTGTMLPGRNNVDGTVLLETFAGLIDQSIYLMDKSGKSKLGAMGVPIEEIIKEYALAVQFDSMKPKGNA